MNKVLLYFTVLLILVLLMTLDTYSFQGIEVFKTYADRFVFSIAVPFFNLYKITNTFFENFSEKSILIRTLKLYSKNISDLKMQNVLLENQLNVYRYLVKTYSQFSDIPNLKAKIVQVKLMLDTVFLLDYSFEQKAYAIDSKGHMIGIVRNNKLYSIYSRDFKCKIVINNGDNYGILERKNGVFKLKYLQSIPDGKVFACDNNLQVLVGETKNEQFFPYFKLHYLPRVIVLWESNP